ncbi:hypothetical protein [Acetivibrio cellulolyticus]|uniref:hypothetical protein n=1 Tax=Acetivibrio cellulolyticus TaxID=35830 RepID=UPI0001E2F5C2|nr:hypothetical protein [Acetivibrio cellulolyticus]
MSDQDGIRTAPTDQSGTTLTASVTASAEYTRTFKWTIDKTVNPEKWDLFRGDQGVSLYSITVSKDEGTDLAVITGQVCVTNGGAVATENLSILLNLAYNPDGGFENVPLSDTARVVDLSGMPIIQSGASYCYDYSITIPTEPVDYVVPGATYKVTADITITNHSGHLGTPFGPSPSADTILPGTPTSIHGSIEVTDTNGVLFTGITHTETLTYEKTFSCDSDKGTLTNTATIIYEDDKTIGPSDSATVTVNCNILNVSKTATTSYTRTYNWSIDKKVSEDDINFADTTIITLPIGGIHNAYYRVSVIPMPVDGNFMASGTITVTNNAPISATILGITDEISGVGPVTVTCQTIGSFPFVLAGGETHICGYMTTPGQILDKTTRINTVTVTILNYRFSYTGNTPEAIGETSFSAQANVIFSDPTEIIDESVSISDDLYGTVGEANVLDPTTQTLNYKREIGPYSNCGNRTVVNTATFTTADTGATGSDTATVYVKVPCAGCTFTIGYWKTHAGFTGNNPDLVSKHLPIWLGTPNGAKSIQVTTPEQAVAILSFSGDASNGINKLYAQLLGAKLNIDNGADPTAVV